MKKLIMYLYSIITSLFLTTKQPVLQENPNLPMRLGDLQFFASDGGDGGEGGDDGGAGDDDKGDKPFAVFNTQDDLNKRISRAEKAGQKALAKELGFDSIEAMQAALKKDDKPGKGDDKKDDPVDVDKVIEEKLKEVTAQAFKRLLNAEVKLVANELGFADHSDALALADLSDVKENEKGDLEGVKEALEKLAKEKPHLIKSSGSGSFGSDINRKPKDDKAHLENIAKLAQNRGAQVTVANDPWKR